MLVQKANYTMLGKRAFCTTLQVWNRYRSIPSSRRAGGSSLDTLFDEFDKDGDGHLTAAEIASALNSRGVLITEQEAAMFIKGACRPASSLCASFACKKKTLCRVKLLHSTLCFCLDALGASKVTLYQSCARAQLHKSPSGFPEPLTIRQSKAPKAARLAMVAGVLAHIMIQTALDVGGKLLTTSAPLHVTGSQDLCFRARRQMAFRARMELQAQ